MNTSDHSLAWWALKVAMGTILIVLLAERYLLVQGPAISAPPRLLGQVLVVVGGAIALGHYALLKRRNHYLSRPCELITEPGLYRYLRHPMYLGDLFVFGGLTMLAPGPISLACLAIGVYAVYRQSRVEDRYMVQRFGSAQELWAARTGLLLPRLATRRDD
jgi:protein-S-isoprenylcysteine O-methyltransferase Ste14